MSYYVTHFNFYGLDSQTCRNGMVINFPECMINEPNNYIYDPWIWF